MRTKADMPGRANGPARDPTTFPSTAGSRGADFATPTSENRAVRSWLGRIGATGAPTAVPSVHPCPVDSLTPKAHKTTPENNGARRLLSLRALRWEQCRGGGSNQVEGINPTLTGGRCGLYRSKGLANRFRRYCRRKPWGRHAKSAEVSAKCGLSPPDYRCRGTGSNAT